MSPIKLRFLDRKRKPAKLDHLFIKHCPAQSWVLVKIYVINATHGSCLGETSFQIRNMFCFNEREQYITKYNKVLHIWYH